MEAAVYRVRQGYTINLPFRRLLRGGELLENPAPDLVKQNAWKLEPVEPGPASLASNPLPVSCQGGKGPGGAISIIIPAWKADGYLRECLDSLQGQTYFADGETYEILLGIDGCKATRKQALKIAKHYEELKIYWFSQNYGPYLVKNSLAALAKHERLLFFDADDIAQPDMVACLVQHDQGDKGAAVYMLGMDMSSGETKQTCGVFLIRRKNFLALGGFMPWRCASDTEFMNRLSVAGIEKACPEGEPLMRRRVHENQITVKPDTGFGSELRACYMSQIKQIRRLRITNIGLVTAKSERIG